MSFALWTREVKVTDTPGLSYRCAMATARLPTIESEDKGKPCPHCEKTIPREWIDKAFGEFNAQKRRNLNGAPKILKSCGCGWVGSTREIREHDCPDKPPRGKEGLASDAQRKAYLTNGKGLWSLSHT